MILDAGLRLCIDHRPQVGVQTGRVAGFQLGHGASQHRFEGVRNIVLYAYDATSRTTLPGTLEGGLDNVLNRLFHERGGVDDHRIDAAGLGDQGQGAAASFCERGGNAFGGVGRTGKTHAVYVPVCGQGGAHRAIAKHQVKRIGGDTSLVQQSGGFKGDERGLLSRFGEHRVSDREGGADLAKKDRERKIPGTDTGHRAEWFKRRDIRSFTLIGVIVQKVDGFANLGISVHPRLSRFGNANRHEARFFPFQQVRRAAQSL